MTQEDTTCGSTGSGCGKALQRYQKNSVRQTILYQMRKKVYFCKLNKQIYRQTHDTHTRNGTTPRPGHRSSKPAGGGTRGIQGRSTLHRHAAYLGSDDWRRDLADDERGLLPADLKRGVLSEDGIWNLLERNRELLEEMQQLSTQLLQNPR